jgi:hypothetical protein
MIPEDNLEGYLLKPLFKGLLNLCLILILTGSASAQSGFYNIFQIREIRLEFSQADWREQLDSLMSAGDDSTRITAKASIDGIAYPGAGVRFKGFSSWKEGELKNPFNIELDYSIGDRNYQGYKKIKLSNVIHDPSFLREVLAYSIARRYMIAPEANYAMVYVNDTLLGLYTNVESVDDVFLDRYFGDRDGILIKGSPQQLVFPFGQNANLKFISNTDSLAYAPYYQLDSDFGWQALMRMIDVLNNQSDSIEYVLNLDRVLWMHAFNYAFLNLDSYIGYAQNYYLAMDNQGRFNTIPWDLNMSFGSFRSSDGSTHFGGLSINQLKVLDPLQHLSFSVSPRPLLSKVLQDSTWRRMYMAHIRTLMENHVVGDQWLDLAEQIQTLIAPYVLADTNKFYSDSAFVQNIYSTVGGSGGMISYVGLKELMDARLAYLQTYPGYQGEPEYGKVGVLPAEAAFGETIWLNAELHNASEAWLYYRQGRSSVFVATPMFDDGLHYDNNAGDGIYGVSLDIEGNLIDYYFYAQNDSAGAFLPAAAQTDYFTFYPIPRPGVLVINEIYRHDPSTTSADLSLSNSWIELFNASKEPASLKGLKLHLSEQSAMATWLPDSILPGHGYLIVMAGASGANYISIPSEIQERDALILKHGNGLIIDSLAWSEIAAPLSYGRYLNGNGPFRLMQPSFAARNLMPSVSQLNVRIIPNPARDQLEFLCRCEAVSIVYRLFDSSGRLCRQGEINTSASQVDYSHKIPLAGLNAGVFTLLVDCGGQLGTQKVIVYE